MFHAPLFLKVIKATIKVILNQNLFENETILECSKFKCHCFAEDKKMFTLYFLTIDPVLFYTSSLSYNRGYIKFEQKISPDIIFGTILDMIPHGCS